MDIRILLPAHNEAILAYAKSRLMARDGEGMEAEMKSWTARWRQEALDHYVKQGWSFGRFDGEGQLNGFLLAQPYLFHRGLTQTLWIEHLEADSPEIAQQLLTTAYAWARDKHFQCVLIEDSTANRQAATAFSTRLHPAEAVLELRSARF